MRAALATWLNSKNEFQKTIEAVPLEKALQSRELFLQYLDTLKTLGASPSTKFIFPLEFASFLRPIADYAGRATSDGGKA